MKNTEIQFILAAIAEDAAPSAEINLWTGLSQHLVTSESRSKQGDASMKPKFARISALSLGALAGLAIIAVIAFLLATPQGQAFAESMFSFFTRVPVPQGAPTVVHISPAEATAGVLRTPQPKPANIQPDFAAQCGPYENPTCSVQQIRSMVSFEVQGLSKLPDGMRFTGATGSPKVVILQYENEMGAILLNEQPWTEAVSRQMEVSTTAQIESVSIATAGSGQPTEAEYVQGYWGGAGLSSWYASPDFQTLVWRTGDTLYIMQAFGTNQYQGQVLDKEGMAVLAGSLSSEQLVLEVMPDRSNPHPLATEEPATEPWYFAQTAQEAQDMAGFEVIEPTWLPKNYSFFEASYQAEKENVCLFYKQPSEDPGFPSLVIIENASGALPNIPEWSRVSWEGWPQDPSLFDTPTSLLPVSGAPDGQATLTEIGQDSETLCGKIGSGLRNRTVLWKTAGGRSFIIMGNRDSDSFGAVAVLTTLEARRLAENLNSASSIPADTLDPERLQSVQEAETLLGSKVRVPGILPKGYEFNFAQYEAKDQARIVRLIYETTLIVSMETGPTESLDEIYNQNPEGYRHVTVDGLPGLYTQGCVMDGKPYDWTCIYGPHMLTWFEDGMEYRVITNYPRTRTQDELLAIANSMK